MSRMTIQCPRCLASIVVPKSIYRTGGRCTQCGAELRVSPTYARVLSVLSMWVGVVLLWVVHVRVLDFFVFVVPMWLVVLSIMVRVVPHFVPPRLELRGSSETVLTLGLTDQGEEEEHHTQQF
ncbi:MAG: hypothetical protein WCF26_06560 [Candidatus Sulfotelmatobacter sp.]